MDNITSMDQLENVESFKSLVNTFSCRLPKIDKQKANMPRNDDTIIAARIRPLLPEEKESGQTEGTLPRNDGMIDLHSMTLGLPGGPKLRSSEFYLDHVYGPKISTEHVYKQLAAPLVDFALLGGIGTLFAYGQTGSGKTFTVSGIEKLVAEDILGRKIAGSRHISLSIFELGNTLNSGYDLLSDRKPVQILEDSFGETRIVGAAQPRVSSAEEFIALIDKATELRKTQATAKNEASSRSHAVCRISIADPTTPAAPGGVLYLVDLAGSEAARDMATHNSERMKETREINNSLSVLKDCIRGRANLSISSGKRAYMPFRQSVLTKTLKHLFDPVTGRACKMSVIACINPSFLDVGPSKNTLRYAEMLRVPVPGSKPLVSDPENPSSWSNQEVHEWITKNSGEPAIDPSFVAPYHTGIQIVQMDDMEFVQRCMKSTGVSKEQASAFRSKLWQMHVDSRRPKKKKDAEYDPYKQSSQVPPEIAKIAFKERIRPGIVVRYRPKKPTQHPTLAMVLCPDWAVETDVKDMNKEAVCGTRGQSPKRYLCSLINPAIMKDSYQLDAWNQLLIDINDMEAEVTLEFDPATRFYFISV